jgi:hypothetical protein
MNRFLRHLSILALAVMLSACGATPQHAPGLKNIKAVIKAGALTADRNIAGIDLTITVPAGVTPPFNADGTVYSEATVVITREPIPGTPYAGSAGSGSSKLSSAEAPGQTLVGATFTPSSPTSSGKLIVTAIVADGFKATDEVTIHLNVAADATPVASDFALLSFDAYDTGGAAVPGLTPSLTTNIH